MARDKGSGSVYQDSRGTWRASYEIGYNPDGSRRRGTVSAKTKTEAQAKLKERLREINATGASLRDARTATVKSYSEAWLERRVLTQRPKAMERDKGAISNWVVTTIGRRRLADLSPVDVRSVHSAILKAGRSPASARRVHTALMKMLKDATLDGYPVPPRVLLVDAPPPDVTDREGPDVGQSAALLRAAAGGPDESRWLAALLQGMRQGECLGLTWGAVDLDQDMIDVSWQLQALPYEHGCDGCGQPRPSICPARKFRVPLGYEVRLVYGQWCLVRPKTARGQRRIPITPWMHEALVRHRESTDTTPESLVWRDGRGRPRKPRDDLAAWHKLQELADVEHPSGRRFHVHEARHSTATLLMELGVPESVRTAILGHAQASTTRIYEHSSIEQARSALAAAEGRLRLPSVALSPSRPELLP